MTRRVKVIAVIVGVVVFSYLVRTQKEEPSQAINSSLPTEVTPQPAVAPTVEPPGQQAKSGEDELEVQDEKPSGKSTEKPKKKQTSEEESSTLSKTLRNKLNTTVKLYASWPGSVPKQTLLAHLREQKPYITEDAITEIKAGWSDTPLTFKVKVVHVNLDPALTNSEGSDPSTASITAYVTLEKHYTPVSGEPESKTSTQPFTVLMRIINRRWTIISITPQSTTPVEG